MFKYIALLALVACVAANAADDEHAEVKELKSNVREDGFDYALETTNYIREQASGDAAGNIHGFYEFISPEGEHIKVEYVADEYGFKPKSDALPTRPPIPEAIIKSINYIKSKEVHPAQHG